MIESFWLALSVVIPLVVYMAIGGLVRKFKIFSIDNFKALNTVAFKVFIPLSLFFNVYDVDLVSAIEPTVLIFVVIAIPIMFFITWLIVSRFIKDKRNKATVTQGIYRSNFVLFGSSIAAVLCDASGVALVGSLSAIVIPMYNVFAVILFELNRGDKVSIKGLLIEILKNPLVDAGVLGALFNVLKFNIPELLVSPLSALGAAATPIALFSLGGILSFKSIVDHRKYLIIASGGRLVLIPFIMITIAIFIGFRDQELIALMAIFASPTAVASVPMAQAMGGNGELAGEIVALTSVVSVITIFLFVFTLSGMNWI